MKEQKKIETGYFLSKVILIASLSIGISVKNTLNDYFL